jgi:hypothetical protein
MRKSTKSRLPLLVTLAAAIAFSISACGSVTLFGSSPAASASNSPSGSTAAPVLSSGQSGSVGSAGTPTGGSGAGSTGGLSGAGSTASGSGSGGSGQIGASGGGSGVATASTGLSPDQVAQYCKGLPYDPTIDGGLSHNTIENWQTFRRVTPVQFVPNVDVMITDYTAIWNGKRIYNQVRDELIDNYKPLKDFHDQIC